MAFTDSADDDTTGAMGAASPEDIAAAATPPAGGTDAPAPKQPDTPEPKQPDMPDFLKGAPDFIGGLIGQAIRSIRPPNPVSEPFIPGPLRLHGQWGKPDHHLYFARRGRGLAPGPYMPQAGDIRRVLRGVLGNLSRYGSQNVAMLAQGAGVHNDRWWRDYYAGREAAMRLHDHEEKRHLDELESLTTKESEEYGVAFDTYKGKDSNKLMQELYKIANKYGDNPMLEFLNKGDLDGAYRLKQAVDHNSLTLGKLAAQRDKFAETQRKEEEESRSDAKFFSTAPPKTEAATPPTGPAPDGTPPAAPAGPTLPDAPPNVDSAGQRLQMGEKPADVVTTQRQLDAAQARKDQLDAYMRALIADKTLTPDQVKAAIRAKNPAMADAVDSMLEAGAMPTMTESTKPATRMALNLARRVDPNFTRTAQSVKDKEAITRERQENAARLATLRPDVARLQENITQLRTLIPKNVRDMDQLITIASKTNKSGVPALQRWINAGRQKIAGDEDVTSLDTQMHTFQRDAGQILTSFSGGGRGVYTVYAQKSMKEFVDVGATPGQLRAMGETLKRDYENLLVPMVNEVNRVNKSLLGDKAQPVDADDILSDLRAGRPDLPEMPTFRQVK